MSRLVVLGGLGAAVAGGYVLGRRTNDVRVAFERAFHLAPGASTTEVSLTVTRRPSLDTEFDHVAEHEHDERHRIADESKGRPLSERERRERRRREGAPGPAASRPLLRDRDDVVAPRPY